MGEMESLLRYSYKRHHIECPTCPYVFHFEGKQIGDFRKSWATACALCEVPGLLFHDLRGQQAGAWKIRGCQIRRDENYRPQKRVDVFEICRC
jgi:hypothetical protein